MNLQNERNYQAALQALEDLKLLPENQKIAEEYLDMTKEADAGLLKKTVRQSFYKMDEKDTQSSIKYINHSLERQRTEEVERYIRLLFAMGGSTICYAIKDRWLRIRYVLSRESSGLGPVLRSVLSPAQLLAVVAEDIVRTEDSLKRENFQNFWDEKNTEVLREARKYCWSEYNNAEILLAAIYLNKKRWEAKEPEQKKGLALLFSKRESQRKA